MGRLLTAAAAALALLAAATGQAAARDAGGAAPGDLTPEVVADVARSVLTPDAPPRGANDWSCRPTAKHPRPVVLVHGATENPLQNFASLAPALKAEGYCVYTVAYGELSPGALIKGLGPVPQSARQLAAFVDRVLKATGAARADLVGHSLGGGMLPRWYLRFEGGAAKVGHLVGIAPTNHGTTVSGLGELGKALNLIGLASVVTGPSMPDMLVGSEVNRKLDAGGDTVPGVRYTVIASMNDLAMSPYTREFLTAGPGAQVGNTTVQDHCPFSFVGHIGMVYDPAVEQLVKSALDPSDRRAPRCTPVVLPF
ncbi:alpha/beta fold hydrolase [Streptomyces sp. NPDC001941]|uniref:esterase/lipase family protein n=1 Tax=Streptomyces sp. NPDC001941 TaxID=3154659 RepID=UPI003331FED7